MIGIDGSIISVDDDIRNVESASQDRMASNSFRSRAPLSDQLIRASTSISLNIAEGNGRWHKGDKKQFFWIARGSVFECVAILQAASTNAVIAADAYKAAYENLQTLAKMLTKLIQSVDDLRTSYPTRTENRAGT